MASISKHAESIRAIATKLGSIADDLADLGEHAATLASAASELAPDPRPTTARSGSPSPAPSRARVEGAPRADRRLGKAAVEQAMVDALPILARGPAKIGAVVDALRKTRPHTTHPHVLVALTRLRQRGHVEMRGTRGAAVWHLTPAGSAAAGHESARLVRLAGTGTADSDALRREVDVPGLGDHEAGDEPAGE